MPLFIDTNIIIEIMRDSSKEELLIKYLNPENESFAISYVSVAEIKSIAMQNEWGVPRMKKLQKFLDKGEIIELAGNAILDRYVEIDAFSQGKHPTIPSKHSSKNMGKNDLWIAATASILDILLITTDADYDHLDSVLLKLQKVPLTIIQEIRKKK